MLYHNFNYTDKYKQCVCLYFMNEFKHVIWELRNAKLYNKDKVTINSSLLELSARLKLCLQTDFIRLGETTFTKYWLKTDFWGIIREGVFMADFEIGRTLMTF